MLSLRAQIYSSYDSRDVINLLTNFPSGQCASSLMSPLNGKMIANSKSIQIEYEGACMNAPKEILDYLIDTVEKVTTTGTSLV